MVASQGRPVGERDWVDLCSLTCLAPRPVIHISYSGVMGSIITDVSAPRVSNSFAVEGFAMWKNLCAGFRPIYRNEKKGSSMTGLLALRSVSIIALSVTFLLLEFLHLF